MTIKIKARCESVERNPGVGFTLFIRRADVSDVLSLEVRGLFNNLPGFEELEEGREYWITIDPAFPRLRTL